MNLKNKKKGFTIVELVIVIAVIGVLAAILIPTFAGLIHKAHIASDQSLVRNLNTALAIDEVENGKHKTMHDTLVSIDINHGYDIATISSKSNNDIVWDSTNNRFVLVLTEKGKTIYYTGTNNIEYKDSDLINLWKIYSNLEE